MKLKTLYLFLLLFATLQLHAQCTNYASGEAISLDGEEICFVDIISFDIIINTNGPAVGESYDIEIIGSNGSFGFGFGDDGGLGFGDLIIDPVEGCDPIEVFADFMVYCGETGDLLGTFTEGPFVVYPELTVEIVPPGCNEGENGSATLMTLNGDICEGPIEGTVGMVGDCDTQQPGMLSYNFMAFEGTFCEASFVQNIETSCTTLAEGCTDDTACNYDPEAVCDDGSCVFAPCCPRPLPDQFPTAICADNFDAEYCVTFDGDISEIDEGTIFLDSDMGNFGFPNSINPDENQICFFIAGFPIDPCMPTLDNFTLSYFCPNIGQDVFISDILINIYPPPFQYEISVDPTLECGGTPDLSPPPCGELFIGNIVAPINDCDNPVPGVVPYDIDPGFPIEPDAPDCFTAVLFGEVPIQPCLADCPCDGEFCNGVCVDLMVEVINFPAFSCSDDGFDFQLDITGEGAVFSNYFISISGNNNNNIFTAFHDSGDATTYFPFIFPSLDGCTPQEQIFTYEIRCQGAADILAAGTIGTATVYPSPFNFFPNITPSVACGQNLVIEAACGTVILDPDPIPTPECGGMDAQVNWSIDFGFEYPPECAPFPIEGTETVFACAGEPGDPCDGGPCTTNGVLDENCNCISEAPTLTLDSEVPQAVCADEAVIFTATLDSEPGPEGVFVAVSDPFGNFFALTPVAPGNPLTVDVEAFFFTNQPCTTSSFDLTLELLCGSTFTPIGTSISLGTITVYPSPTNYEVFSQPSPDCGGVPTLFPPSCGELVIGNITDPINDCDNPVPGVVPYDIDPGFLIDPDAPDCFTAVLGGEVPIAPCLQDCPCDGIVCDAVCTELIAVATNLPAFSCPDDGFQFQLDITGTGADFAEYFILINDNNGNNVGFEFHDIGDPTTYFPFIFPFINGCTPEDQTFTYEIQCPADGAILAEGTVGTVTVYPSPFNFSPNIIPSVACSQDLVIEATCGTVILDPDPIPTPGCGGADTEVNWSIDFGFEYPAECAPVPIEGTAIVFACAGAPGDPCDGGPCTANGVLDENCNCISEAPIATLDSAAPQAICAGELLILTVSLDSEPGPDGVFVVISDQFNNFPGFFPILPGDPLTVDIEASFFTNGPCDVPSYDLTLELLCGATFTPIGTSVPLGTITVYPLPNVDNAPGGACTDAVTDNCGNSTILYSTDGFATPGTTTPPTLNPGDADVLVDWVASIAGAPENCEVIGTYTLTCPGEASITVDISDPCSCEAGIGTCPATATPPGNIDVDGDGAITDVDYVADVITITVSPPVPGQAWEIANPGGALDCTGASIGAAGLTDQGGGIYTITVYYPADGSGFGTMTFASDLGETVSITNPSADYMACDCTPPMPPTCDLTVLTANFVCDDNNTPEDATDDTTSSFSITVTDTGGAAGTMWTADDGMGNTITGMYGTATMLAPATIYPAGTVLTLVVTDTADPTCSTTVDVTIGNCATVDNIPTVGEWGLIMLALLMSIVAVVGIRQRTMTIIYQEIEE